MIYDATWIATQVSVVDVVLFTNTSVVYLFYVSQYSSTSSLHLLLALLTNRYLHFLAIFVHTPLFQILIAKSSKSHLDERCTNHNSKKEKTSGVDSCKKDFKGLFIDFIRLSVTSYHKLDKDNT